MPKGPTSQSLILQAKNLGVKARFPLKTRGEKKVMFRGSLGLARAHYSPIYKLIGYH